MSGYQRVGQLDEQEATPAPAPSVPAAPAAAAAPAPAPFSLSALFGAAPRQTEAAAAAQCAEALRSQYGAHVPAFQGLGFEEAMVVGQRSNRPVLVYLQSDLHGDTDDFLRSALCTPEVCEVVRSVGYVAWAGRVHERSGWEASLKLEATGFPFLAIFMPQAGSSSSSSSSSARGATTRSVRVWSMEGGSLPSAAALVADLRRWGSQARGVLEEASMGRRAQESARSREREMRENQEREYRAAEEADAAQDRARSAAAAAAAEAQRQQAEAAAAAEDARELELAMRLSLRSDVEESLAAARARLAASPEPPAGAAVRIQLPTGTKLQRRFPPTAPLALLVDYIVVSSVDLGQGLDPGSFDLVTTHPRRTWNTHAGSKAQGGESEVTLQEAGLAGAVVLVQTVGGR